MVRRSTSFVLLALAALASPFAARAQTDYRTPPVVEAPDFFFIHPERLPEPGAREDERPIPPREWIREVERIARLLPAANPRSSTAFARREGGVLTLGLADGRSLSFFDSTRDCSWSVAPKCVAHVFADWLDPGWYVITRYERGDLEQIYVVSQSDGRVWRFYEPTFVISRDRRFGLAYLLTAMHGYNAKIVRFTDAALIVDAVDVLTACEQESLNSERLHLYDKGREPVRTAADRIDFLKVGVDTPDAGPGSVHLLRRDGKWRMICEP